MENMPTLSNNFLELDKEKPEILFKEMQWKDENKASSKDWKTYTQSFRGNKEEIKQEIQRKKQPSMERRSNLHEEERKLWKIQNKICEMPKKIYSYGEKGWLCNGTPINNCKEIEQMPIENRSYTPQRPQAREQSNRESSIIPNKQETQNLRGIRIEKAKITKEEYSGLVFCPTVSTGCFVARRKGKIFITGNSGFPKSLNISKNIGKQIDSFIKFNDYDLIWKNKKIKDVFNVENQLKKSQIEVENNIEKRNFVLKNALESIQKEEELSSAKIVENLSSEVKAISKNTFIVLQNAKEKNAISKQNVKFVVKNY